MLFLADFPEKDSLKDGMLQRIVSIDSHYRNTERIYLHISFRKNFRRRFLSIDEDGIAYKCNFFFHFFFIWNQFKMSQTWYFHSVYNVFPVLFLLFNKRKVKIIWDVHGAVPEELKMTGKFMKAAFFSGIERIIYNKTSICIVLTKAMQIHFEKKYGHRHDLKFVEHQIFPSNILNRKVNCNSDTNDRIVNIIYAGNTQVWQNIDLMMMTIKDNLNANFVYYILTGEPDRMKRYLEQHGLFNNRRIILKSVPPNELEYFYNIAHYGFVLRDDVVVNNVACPTKIIEYMSYGIIPIVKTENIGDFYELGYEFIKYHELHSISAPRKSEINKKIVEDLLEQNFSLAF